MIWAAVAVCASRGEVRRGFSREAPRAPPAYAQRVSIGIILILVVLAVVVSLATKETDTDRIRDHLAAQQCELLSCETSVLSGGGLGTAPQSYRVRYRDGAGIEHDARCRTSWVSGVRLTED